MRKEEKKKKERRRKRRKLQLQTAPDSPSTPWSRLSNNGSPRSAHVSLQSKVQHTLNWALVAKHPCNLASLQY